MDSKQIALDLNPELQTHEFNCLLDNPTYSSSRYIKLKMSWNKCVLIYDICFSLMILFTKHRDKDVTDVVNKCINIKREREG